MQRRTAWRGLCVVVCCLIVTTGATPVPAQETITLDPSLKGYVKVSGLSGDLTSIGSDTLNKLMTGWAEAFRKQIPPKAKRGFGDYLADTVTGDAPERKAIKVLILGKGSSTAPPALIQGKANLGPMSRPMTETEIEQFESKFGYRPTAFPVAIDALAIYANKDNPITGLTMAQVDAIFSKTRRWGYREDIRRWGQVGVTTGEFANAPINPYGRNGLSGTYGFFKEHALKNGALRDEVKEQPGSETVMQRVAEDRAGIGYSSIGYRLSGVRAVPLAEREGQSFKAPTQENATDGSYPIWRYLYIYVNKVPNKPLDPIVREFLKYVYSKEGQQIVIEKGSFPLPAATVEKELQKL